jgi:hypothetical protein
MLAISLSTTSPHPYPKSNVVRYSRYQTRRIIDATFITFSTSSGSFTAPRDYLQGYYTFLLLYHFLELTAAALRNIRQFTLWIVCL